MRNTGGRVCEILRNSLGDRTAGPFGATAQSVAVTVPFAEGFDSSTSNWKNVASLDLTHVGTGGPDGSGYVTTLLPFTSAPTGSSVLFRGHDVFNSSGDAFVGNWLAAGVQELSAYVRHDAPEPVDFFARLATPANFPGVIFSAPALVQPNAWTLKLSGDGHAGLGVAAWNLDGRLYASGLRGILYRLSNDGATWEEVAELGRPRFFHQLLPAGDGGLLAVGGASRDGHIAEIEWINVANN